MSTVRTLSANLRPKTGKGGIRAVRRAGLVPAVIYGNNQEPILISLPMLELVKQVEQGGFFNSICEIKADNQNHRVLPRDIQLDPITSQPIHVDFMRFSANTKLTVEVGVRFINEETSPGLKRGGVLNIVRHAVELLCVPDSIPQFLTVDLDGTQIGDSIHISAISLPEGVAPTITDRDFTIATIAAPTITADPIQDSDEEADEDESEDETQEEDEN